MILFNTLTFDPITEEVIWMDGKRRSKDAFISSGFKPDTVKEIFDIWKFCSKTNLAEPTTLSLIVASVITSPDRHIFQGQCDQSASVSRIHESIVDCLHSFLTLNNPTNSFVKAMSLMVKLRNLTDMILPRQLESFMQQKLPMEPLLAEIYHLKNRDVLV
jgi:hypothetical protein